MKNTIAPLCLLLSLLGAQACTSAGKCTRGEEDCAVVESGGRACAAGLVEEDGFCVRRSGSSGSGGSGGSSAGSGGGTGGSGGSGEPDAGPPVECTGDNLADACAAFCEAFCQNEQALCVESRCSAGDCEPGGEVFIACNDICADDPDGPEQCAQGLCLGQAEYKCEDFGAVDSDTGIYVSLCFGNDPDCVGNPDYGCSDTCGTIDTDYGGVGSDLTFDSLCEDGGGDSVSSACARGTDCTDCGERMCAAGGESCGGHGDCCGFYENGALCVELASGPTCLVSCTDSGTCDDGLRCVEVDDNRNSVCAP